MSFRVWLLIGLTCVAATATASPTHPKTDQEKFSYALGFRVAAGLRHDGIELDRRAFVQAINDVLENRQPRLSISDMQDALNRYRAKKIKEQAALAEKNAKAGEAFLAANKKKKGVVVLPSGLQYKIIKNGTGKRPQPTDTVRVNYTGKLINGKVFDSSARHGGPAEFQVNSVIKGWQEILPLMKTGAKWKVYVPADLAYGPRGAGGAIGPNETLIFDIELLSIKK